MPVRISSLLSLTVLVLAVGPTARAEIEAEKVRSAIERASAFLKTEQEKSKNGSWPDHTGQDGGVTALCTLALLNAGTDPDDEHIQRALQYLRKINSERTYTSALQIMVFATASPTKDRVKIQSIAERLQRWQIKGGEKAGAWSYGDIGAGDNSNAQFALLGLYEAERVGAVVRPDTWRKALDYWTRTQNEDGSWGYMPGMPGTGSMTCAGIASVIIASGALSKGDAEIVAGRVKCCGQQESNDTVERALSWLDQNFSVQSNPGHGIRQGSVLYYLYGVERVGRMTARRFIGNHDWYREGADHLIHSQAPLSDYWVGPGPGESNERIGTALVLLFLSKGRRPILVSKLKHGPGDDWDRHRHDLDNLTRYVESKWKRDMTWQVIDPALANVDDLLQSPVLFLNGKQAPQFNDEQKRRLRDYVDRGGFIFAEACCEGDQFEQGFQQLMKEVFPEEDYQLRQLPPEHPIWRTEEQLTPDEAVKYAGSLWGIDIGCRTSVVLCTKDLSCYWELARSGREQKFPPEIQEDIAAAETIGINVLAYATNRELKFKEETFETAASKLKVDKFDRGKMYVAKLKHPGGCNAAPTALSNLMETASNQLKIRVSNDIRETAITDPELFNYHIVFMHGRHSFRLTDHERKQLKAYLTSGGMLFVDAICSSEDFANAFRREMKEIFPEQPLDRIPVNHGLFTTEFGGEDLAEVSRRQPQGGEGPLKSSVREGEPFLEGIKLADRYAVIFSRYDISCALESHESLECEGYTKKDAARLGLNVLLYSLHQ